MVSKFSKTLLILTIILSSFSFAQGNRPEKSKGKSFYTIEEVRQRCGIHYSKEQRDKAQIKQDSMYNAYLKSQRLHKETSVSSIPDWRSYMGLVDNQSCGNCWAEAAVGVVEGKLQYFIGSNVGIDLDEMDVTNNSGAGDCSGGSASGALGYIQNSRVPVEPGYSSFPNYPGVKYGISGYSYTSGIDGIKSALINSPVLASFDVYADFSNFFYYHPGAVYRHDQSSSYVGGHSVVIVGYDDSQQCWICKNSWGSNWGDNGYFRIAYGQCLIESMEDITVSVNSGSLAKIVPNFFSTLNSVMGNSFSSTEAVYLTSGTQSLSANINAASGVTMNFLSGSTINLGSYYIMAGNIVSNANIPALNVDLRQSTGITGLFPSIQSACDNVGTGQTIELLKGSYSSGFSLSKNSVNISGNGAIINGVVHLNNSSSCNIRDLHLSGSGNSLYISGGSTNYINNYHGDNPTGALNIYNSTNCQVTSLAATNGDPGEFAVSIESSTGDVCYNSDIEGYACGVHVGYNSNFNITDDYFCHNYCDVDAENGGYAYLMRNSYSRLNPLNIIGNCYVSDTPTLSCSGLSKSAAQNQEKATIQSISTYSEVNKKYLDLINRISKDDIKDPKELKSKYKADYDNLISQLKSSLNQNSTLAEMKNSLSLLNHCYKGLDEKDAFYSLTSGILSTSRSNSFAPYIKRYMIDNYIESQDYKGAVALADEILNTKGIDQDLTCEMLYEKGLINKFYLKNNTEAYRSFSLLTSQYPKNVLAKMAKGQMSDLPKDSEKPYLNALSKEADGFKCSNYPNPFNPTTRFNFSIPKDGYTELRIYNSLGQEVKTLVSENLSKGQYSFEWNANNCASGIYYYTLKSGDQVSTYKMILMK